MPGDETEEVVILTDRERCAGHAQCNSYAPSVFGLDDRGYTDLPPRFDVPRGSEEAAIRGSQSCPEGVFTVERRRVARGATDARREEGQ